MIFNTSSYPSLPFGYPSFPRVITFFVKGWVVNIGSYCFVEFHLKQYCVQLGLPYFMLCRPCTVCCMYFLSSFPSFFFFFPFFFFFCLLVCLLPYLPFLFSSFPFFLPPFFSFFLNFLFLPPLILSFLPSFPLLY